MNTPTNTALVKAQHTKEPDPPTTSPRQPHTPGKHPDYPAPSAHRTLK